jgi:hypothetical protein
MTEVDTTSVDAARAASERDELGEWVEAFLRSPGSDNAELAEQLTSRPRWWVGPMSVRLDQLHRLAGPPGEPVLVETDEEDWSDDVDDLVQRVADGWEPPPVIVSYRDDQLVLEDGNHRVEAVRRAGGSETWAVVGFDDPDERERFGAADAP